jgi:hypothetical protein
MIRQCFKVKTGIQFHLESFKDIGLDPTTLFPIVTDRPRALEPSASAIADVKASLKVSAHVAEPSDATLTDETHATPTAASTFKSEEDEELLDALCPIYDQLKLAKAWWILEIIPLRHRVQNRHDMKWKSYSQYVFFPKDFVSPLCHSTWA